MKFHRYQFILTQEGIGSKQEDELNPSQANTKYHYGHHQEYLHKAEVNIIKSFPGAAATDQGKLFPDSAQLCAVLPQLYRPDYNILVSLLLLFPSDLLSMNCSDSHLLGSLTGILILSFSPYLSYFSQMKLEKRRTKVR